MEKVLSAGKSLENLIISSKHLNGMLQVHNLSQMGVCVVSWDVKNCDKNGGNCTKLVIIELR